MSQDIVKRMYCVASVIRTRSDRENACLCFSLMSKPPSQKPWVFDPDCPDPSQSVILDLQDMSEWDMSSTVDPEEHPAPEFPFEDDMQVQCLPVPRSDTPQWMCRKAPKVSCFVNFKGTPAWCRKPQALTYRLCSEIRTRSVLVAALPQYERRLLTREQVLPKASSANGRTCVMCPVRLGSPRLVPCCLREIGVMCLAAITATLKGLPLSHQKRKMVLSHPYLEDYVVCLPLL